VIDKYRKSVYANCVQFSERNVLNTLRAFDNSFLLKNINLGALL